MSDKHILFIYPTCYNEDGQLVKRRKRVSSPRTLPYLAALTPSRFKVSIVDELIQEVDLDQEADLVAFTGLTTHMPRAIDLAGEFKRRGRTTVIGGIGVHSVRSYVEQSGVFDCIVNGEVDLDWADILADFEAGRLQSSYECTSQPPLESSPHARFDLLTKGTNKGFWNRRSKDWVNIETGRGCPHNCSYCFVSRYFGKRMRFRPIENVIEEIKYQRAKYVAFTDDNIAAVPARAEELFRALKKLNIKWFGQFDTLIIRRPELLRLARESGCVTAFLGIESLSATTLRSMKKQHNTRVDISDIGKVFNEVKIPIIASVMLGFDTDTEESVSELIDTLIQNDIDSMFPWICTPLPGTPYFDEMKAQGRLLHENYSLYDVGHVVIRPQNMTPDALLRTYYRSLREFYALKTLPRRVLRAKQGRIEELFINLYFHQCAQKGHHPWLGLP